MRGRKLYGEPWVECAICGFDFPQSQMTRHYKSKRLVDRKCADERPWSEYINRTKPQPEDGRTSEQPVSGQGGYGVEEFEGGAGGGGAGGGGSA